jgi:uncharacterized protein YggE
MTASTLSRPAVVVAGAVLLGAAFWLGSHSGADASAATLPLTVTTGPAPTSSGAPAPSATGITVNGTAQVAGRPDTLRLDLSVSAKADSVGRALADANATMTQVQDQLRRSGVAAKDLQTSNLSVSPDYSYPPGGRQTITGYTVSEGLTATLRDLGRAGQAVTDVVRAGGDAVQVNGLHLDLADTSALVASARDRAVANARTKAEQYAKATGRRLGAVVSLTEAVSEPPPVAYDMRAAAADKAVPIAAGSQAVGVTVTVVYAFG